MITNLQAQGAKFVELLPSPNDEEFGFIVTSEILYYQ